MTIVATNNIVYTDNGNYTIKPCFNAASNDRMRYKLMLIGDDKIGIMDFKTGMGIMNFNSNRIEDIHEGQLVSYTQPLITACLNACPPL